MIVVGGLSIVIQCDEIALGVQSSAQLERECRAFCVPRRLLVPHPLDSNRTADLFREVSRLKARIIGGGAAVTLRPFHPDDTHLFAWHPKKIRNTSSHAIGFHVIGVNRHLAVRRIGRGVRRTERRVALERNIVFGFDDLRCAGQRLVGITDHGGPLARRGRRAAHVFEQIFR